MSAKKTNARIEKWRAMLNVGLYKDQDLLKSRTRKGVPPSLRNIVWPKLVILNKHIQQRRQDFNYQKLVNKLSNNVYEIGLDIPRTFPQEQDSKVLRKSLNDVLKAISIVYPKIGYCQGMNFLARRILEVLDNQQTFWLLHYLFQNDKFLRNNFINPSFIQMHDFIFDQLLEEYLPKLNKELKKKDVFINSFTMKSFLTIYSGCLEKECFNRVFEVFLVQRWAIIYAVALAMFKLNQHELKNKTMESLQSTLTKDIFIIEDVDKLMAQAYKFDLSQQKINKLQHQFNVKKRKSLQSNLISSAQLQHRTQKNMVMKQFKPQSQFVTSIVFQQKPKDQMNFENFELLKHRL